MLILDGMILITEIKLPVLMRRDSNPACSRVLLYPKFGAFEYGHKMILVCLNYS
jgi:hypothetical protein